MIQSAAVQFSGASVDLGRGPVWSDVNVTIEAGDFVAVLGPNGAGKSTMIKAVLALLPLSAGELTVLGSSPGRRNHEIGYLPQRRNFDSGLRVRGIDVVGLGLDGDRWGVPLPGAARFNRRRREHAKRVDEVIDLVGASEYAHRPVGEVSGGEQQRLLIAQALVRKPSILLLDEPLDSLDLPNQASVASLIARICREDGVTVLLVAHDVNPILNHLDQVVYLAHGAALSGPPHEVITDATLTALYDTPIEVLRASDGRLVVVGQPDAPGAHSPRHPH